MPFLVRAARAAAALAAVSLGVLGCVTRTPVVEVLAVAVAILAGLAGLTVAHHRGNPAVRGALLGAIGGAAAVFVVAGLAAVVGPLAVPVTAIVLAAVVWRRRGRLRADPALPGGPPALALDEEDLTGLTNAQLGREWRRSHSGLLHARTTDELSLVCRLRRRQLDEIERRDPDGFRRWVDSGCWVRGDSVPFLGG
jgi:hypothetical protein